MLVDCIICRSGNLEIPDILYKMKLGRAKIMLTIFYYILLFKMEDMAAIYVEEIGSQLNICLPWVDLSLMKRGSALHAHAGYIQLE